MYVLEWVEENKVRHVGIFASLESGRNFMRRVPGYRYLVFEVDGHIYEEEKILYTELPDIAMIEFEGCRVPISRFSFEGDVSVYWIELDVLDQCAESALHPIIAAGSTRIDAYSIPNDEVEDYVIKREKNFSACRQRLEEDGYEVSRECYGSEDGEVIFYRKKVQQLNMTSEEERWKFLTHMDPQFVEMEMDRDYETLFGEQS